MCTVLMGNSSQVLIKKKKKDFFGNFELINLYIHPSQTWQTSLIVCTLLLKPNNNPNITCHVWESLNNMHTVQTNALRITGSGLSNLRAW